MGIRRFCSGVGRRSSCHVAPTPTIDGRPIAVVVAEVAPQLLLAGVAGATALDRMGCDMAW